MLNFRSPARFGKAVLPAAQKTGRSRTEAGPVGQFSGVWLQCIFSTDPRGLVSVAALVRPALERHWWPFSTQISALPYSQLLRVAAQAYRNVCIWEDYQSS